MQARPSYDEYNVRVTAYHILAAIGTEETEDEDQYARAMAGAMAIADGLREISYLRSLVKKAISG